MFVVNPFRFGGGTSGYLDGLGVTPVACIYFSKKLISTATLALRVRRSSDSTEQDIGFSGGVLDTAALLSFCGAGDGFVRTIYDQTGNGFHAQQATAANQPKIVSAGSYLGKAVFDAVNDSLKITSLTNTSRYFALYSRLKQSVGFGGSTGRIIVETSADYNTNTGALIFFSNPTGSLYSIGVGANKLHEDPPLGLGTYSQCSVVWDLQSGVTADIIRAYVNGSEITGTATSAGPPSTFTTYDMNIGSRNGASRFADLETEGFVFYNADTSGIRSSIEALL